VTVSEIMQRSLVAIGASAGGVETLRRVVAGLPADLPGAVCVVLHLAPRSPSALAAILDRAGPLPCRPALDGEPLEAGKIMVAPPDRHLVISDGKVGLSLGPRENGHRPAVDVLFRTAAQALGTRVIGVVLSGTRDDGTAGLAEIKAHGGAAIVQDPDEALYKGMPGNAIAHVDVDAVVPSSEIANTVVRMLGENLTVPAAPSDNPGHRTVPGDSVTSICPECGGVLSENHIADVIQWTCRVGHRYSPESLADAQAENVEGALWAAVRALADRQALLDRMATQLEARGHRRSAGSFRRRADEAAAQSVVVREALGQAAALTLQRIADSENGDDDSGDTGAERVVYGEH
jgi:two-component system, chemotaxis family, protein-glutamate methylesterase/glutaminase